MIKKVPDKILFSKNKIINLGLLIVIFNPLPLGLIYGYFLWREVPTKSEGKLIMIFSFIWGAISLVLFQEYFSF